SESCARGSSPQCLGPKRRARARIPERCFQSSARAVLGLELAEELPELGLRAERGAETLREAQELALQCLRAGSHFAEHLLRRRPPLRRRLVEPVEPGADLLHLMVDFAERALLLDGLRFGFELVLSQLEPVVEDVSALSVRGDELGVGLCKSAAPFP